MRKHTFIPLVHCLPGQLCHHDDSTDSSSETDDSHGSCTALQTQRAASGATAGGGHLRGHMGEAHLQSGIFTVRFLFDPPQGSRFYLCILCKNLAQLPGLLHPRHLLVEEEPVGRVLGQGKGVGVCGHLKARAHDGAVLVAGQPVHGRGALVQGELASTNVEGAQVVAGTFPP